MPLEPANILKIGSEMLERSSDKLRASVATRATLSEIEVPSVSDAVLNPAKSLSATSERGGVSDRNFPADLLMLSEMADVKSSERPLNPLKILDSASDTVGLSERVRNPVKILLTVSEMVLLRSSESARAAESERVTASERTAERSSDILLNPVNNRSATSERGGVSDRNFPADLLMLSVMPARLSGMLLNPVKILFTTSENEGTSKIDLPADLLVESKIVGTSKIDLPADLLIESKIVDRSADDPLNPWKSLVALSRRTNEKSSGIFRRPVKSLESASDIVGVSAGNLDPPKPLAKASEGALLISVRLPDTEIPERRAGHWSTSRYEALVG